VPFIGAKRVRCVYCLTEQEVTTEIARPLEANDRLDAALDQAAARIRGLRSSKYIVWGILALNLPMLALVSWMIFGSAFAQRDDPLAAAMYLTIGIGGVLPFILVPFGWFFLRARSDARRLAALPLSVPVVDDQSRLRSKCPRCGALHDTVVGLTSRCSHCETEAILPLLLVDHQLTRKHQRVLAVKVRGDALTDAATDAQRDYQRFVVPAVIGFCCLFGVVLFAIIIAVEMRGP